MALTSTGRLSAKPLPSVVLFLGYLLAFCALAACLAYWAMQLIAPPSPIAAAGVVAEKSSSLDLSPPGKLFGSVAQAGSNAPAPAVTNIKVIGMMTANNRSRANAILSINNATGQAFAVGDSLGNNTTLVEVNQQGIVIEQNGQRSNVEGPPKPSLAALSKPLATQPATRADPNAPKSSISSPMGLSTATGPTAVQPVIQPLANPSSPPPVTPLPAIQPATPLAQPGMPDPSNQNGSPAGFTGKIR